MTISVTKEDLELDMELMDWWYLDEHGKYRLKEDTPEHLKKHNEKMRKKRAALPS